MHKEAHVTSKEGADPQLSSVISASNLYKPIYSASFIIHSESASGRDASADSTAEADPGNSALYDSLPQQQGRDEGTKTIHLITYLKEREQVRLQKKLKKSALRILNLALIPLLKYSLEDDPNIVVDESEEDDEEVHATSNVELKTLQLPNLCLPENEKRQAEAEVALLSAKPSFPNVVVRYLNTHKGFAAALAILITRASQSRQHNKCKLDLTSHLPRACLMLAQAGFPSSLGLLKYHSDILAKSQG
ncbi:hypothetical protein Tco_0651811 [Tanacetum coccineum]|uniref:Uncharacterized protein n=1 Tax=Tanacetum coccineum TaxID=301880 RepID=A0ABQ4WVU9_9ASTR